MKRRVRLGVNIDHVATVRQARMTFEPDPVHAAVLAELAGADQITLHLREDRRHVQDRDLELILRTVHCRVNLEMAPTEQMLEIALSRKPHQVTLVPENRREITTEGGLDVLSNEPYIKSFVQKLKEAGIVVNLFVDPDKEQIEASARVEADAVEIHTGRYAEARNEQQRAYELEKIKKAAKLAKSLGLKVYAGHGLNYKNVREVAQIEEIEELNIGHSIVANAILKGFKLAVKDMLRLINVGEL